jgi:nucleoside-diphosphate-sugar epimerase
MGKTIFITGATGFLGKRFAKALAQNGSHRLILLVRPRGGESPDQRLASLGLNLPGIEVVPGDISDSAIVEQLAALRRVDEFWHIAGLTEFHESRRAQLEQVNIEGVRHALSLAQRWNVARFFHISTAYVAGICDGPVPEDGLLPNPVFRNPYEETKYRGEQRVRASEIPWIVIRPSILMGDSVTGESDSDKMAYGVCKVYHSVGQWVRREEREGAWKSDQRYRVRGRAEAAKNCICIDDALAMLLAVRERGVVGRTYHCTHPQPTTMGELHAAGADVTHTPIFLSTSDATTDDRKQHFMDKGCRTYEPYMLLSDCLFDLNNTREIAPELRPKPMTAERLRFLFDAYVVDLRERKDTTQDSSLDLSRFPAVRRYGSFTLAYNSMSRQFRAFTAQGADGYLPYAMVDKTAMMVGDPVADRPERLLRDFVGWCDRENRGFCALQIGHATAVTLRELGCCINKLGIETAIDLKRFDPELRGKEYQEIRSYRNVAERFGLKVREQPLSERSREDLQALFADWLDRKKNKQELHLLLRPPSLTPEPDVRHFTAEYQGRLVAAVFFTPICQEGRITEYYADVERYNPADTGFPGRLNFMKLIEFKAAEIFRREGVERIALGMSPLHQVRESEFNDNPELTALFEQLFEESALYAFKGIARHKQDYPCRIEHPVFIATRTQAAAEEVLDLLKGVGLLG